MSFAREYARLYDVFYADKDYEAETKFLVRVARRLARRPVRRVLDLSSGTGGHALALARRGLQVRAMDRSREMTEAAQAKAADLGLDVSFRIGDMRRLGRGGTFDACITMFDSVNYLASLAELGQVLIRVRRRLKPGGVLILQTWNGTTVLREGLRRRRRSYSNGELRIVREAVPTLDSLRQSCEIEYRVRVTRDGHTVRTATDLHRLSIFTLSEVRELFRRAELPVVGVFPPYRLDRALSVDDWSMIVVGRR
jgi:SAM-dependent methyltransferase